MSFHFKHKKCSLIQSSCNRHKKNKNSQNVWRKCTRKSKECIRSDLHNGHCPFPYGFYATTVSSFQGSGTGYNIIIDSKILI